MLQSIRKIMSSQKVMLGAGSCFLLAGPLNANVLEETLVMAQKRAESPQDIGATVNAFSSDDIRELRIQDTLDVGNSLTNTQVTFGFGLPSFVIRGQGLNEFGQNTDSPVAVHIDEVYQSKSFQLNVGLFDIAQIDALKGPQGTLFGRNTTGGTINFITNKPTEEFEAGVNLEYGRFERARGEFYVSGPLTDNLSARVSGYTHQSSDGPTENVYDGENLGEIDQWGVRGQLQWSSGQTDVLLSLHYGEDTSDLLPFQNMGVLDAAALEAAPPGTPNFLIPRCEEYLNGTVRGDTANCVDFAGLNAGEDDPFEVNQDNGQRDPFGPQRMGLDDESQGGYLRVDYQLEESTFTSLTAFDNYIRNTYEDSGATPLVSDHTLFYSDLDVFTQEFRLTSANDGNFSWLTGFFYEHDEQFSVFTYVPPENPDPITGFVLQSTEYVQDTDAAAIFAHTEYHFSEKISLILGARYTWESKDIDGDTFVQLPFIAPVGDAAQLKTPLGGGPIASVDESRTDDNFSFKIGLNYTPSDDILYYGSISTGFRSGGHSANLAFSDTDFNEYDAEEIEAYEIGFKSQLLNNTLQINGAAFYYINDDQQINTDIAGAVLPQTSNGGEGKSTGAELELWWIPLEGLDMKLGLGWLDAEYGKFTLNGIESDGNTAVNAPEFTSTGMVRYQFSMNNGMKLTTVADYSYRDDRYLESSNVPVSYLGGYLLLNARIALASEDARWEVALWGKNLTDEEYVAYLNDLNGLGFVLTTVGDPLTYGIALSYNF